MSEELASNAKWVHENSAEVRIKLICGHTDSIASCQLIDNETKIFTCANDHTARIWDFMTGAQLKKYENLHNKNISACKMSADGTKFITSSWDKTIKCWDTETGKLLWINSHSSFVTSCNFSNLTSKYVISVSDMDYLLKIWDTQTGKLVHTIHDIHSNTITSCKFTPEDDRLVTTSMDKTTKFYDLISGKVTLSLGGHTNVISSSAFSKNMKTFCTASWDKTIQLWDITTGLYRSNGPTSLLNGHEGSVSCCALNENASLCVSGGYDLRVVLWDANYANAKLVMRGHTDWITDVSITSDNKWIVSVGKDGEIRCWDIENCDNIKQVEEQNRLLGNKIITCSQCKKQFSIFKFQQSPATTSNRTAALCVFCRTKNQEASEKKLGD